MRLPLVKLTMLACVCGFVSSCSYSPSGSSLPDNAATPGVASANPPSVFSTQPNIPSASPFYPTGHSSSPSSSSKQALPVTPKPSPDVAVVNSSNIPVAMGSGANAVDSSGSSASDKTDTGSNFDNLDVIDPNLKGKLGVLRVGSEPTSNDLLSVFAGLKNKTAHPLALEVQTIYKDKMGNSLNDGSWIPMTLKPHEETEYRSSSISAEAVDFLVRVRGASTDGSAGAN